MIELSYLALALLLLTAALLSGIFTGLLATRQRVPMARWHEAQAALAGTEAQLQACHTQLADAQQQATHYRQRYEMQYQQTTALSNELARHKANAEAQQQRLQEQQQSMQQYGQLLRQEFQLLANEVLSNKASQFNQQQETKLNDLLQPMRHKLEEFRSELSQKFSAASTERTELKEQVRLMAELNQQLTQQAHNLSKALSSQVKQQGHWGETILETILQHVGLQKDLHYFAQHSSTNHHGEIIRPDFVVRYPDDRYVIIDSKVSLLHYQQYTDAATPAEQQHFKQLLLRSLRQHIDGLSAKQYQHISGSLDQVLLFVPVEGAFITAMQADAQLWQYAYDRHILLLSPTLLLTAMKLIQEGWKQDAVNKNAQQIAERAGKLYDKLVGFVDNFETIGKKLDDAHEAYQQARKQLSEGRGNALAQAEHLRLLNAKTSKRLPAATAAAALLDDEQEPLQA